MDEMSYEHGSRAAWLQMLRTCMVALGHEDIDAAKLILEREEAVQELRNVCQDHGDNDWNSDDYLPDIISKHLARHLPARQQGEDSAKG